MKIASHVQSEFGSRIRELRKSKGLSQEEFSFACELDRTYVSQVEQGRRNISLQNIKAMADALQVPLVELFAPGISCTSTSSAATVGYRVRKKASISCGFNVSSNDILASSSSTAKQLQMLPFSLYQSIDLKTLRLYCWSHLCRLPRE